MTAKGSDATSATPRARLRLDVFDQHAERLGAKTDVAKAKLMGVGPITLWRYRKGHLSPSLTRAMEIAKTLGIELDDLIDRPAA